MRRLLTAVLAPVLALLTAAGLTLAAAAPSYAHGCSEAGRKGCISKRESQRIHQGMTSVRVHKIVGGDPSGAAAGTRKGKPALFWTYDAAKGHGYVDLVFVKRSGDYRLVSKKPHWG